VVADSALRVFPTIAIALGSRRAGSVVPAAAALSMALCVVLPAPVATSQVAFAGRMQRGATASDAAGPLSLAQSLNGPTRHAASTTAELPRIRPLLGGIVRVNSVTPQESAEGATLETRQPDVQWSPAGAAGWQSVPTRQDVRPGDRVRTGSGASAQLVYFEGTVVEIQANTGLLVQRLERSPEGKIASRQVV
jgi:hypothetical protein